MLATGAGRRRSVVLVALVAKGVGGAVAGAFLAVPVAVVCAAALAERSDAGAESPAVALPTAAERVGEAPARDRSAAQ